MRFRSVLRLVQGVVIASVLLMGAACASSAKGVSAGAATASAIATHRPTSTPSTLLMNLGCKSTVHPASSVIDSGPATRNVALTFDDGPSPDYTANILSTLEQTHTPATFFVVGSNVKQYPALVQREANDGFAIGIHTWDHPYMTKLSTQQRQWELAATAQAIHNALGADYCLRYWRPPFGDYNDAVVALARSLGLSTVTWDVDPQDWSNPGVKTIVNRVLSAVHPGAIILMHDGYQNRAETAAALPLIIRGLKRRGYTPVTLPVLLAGG